MTKTPMATCIRKMTVAAMGVLTLAAAVWLVPVLVGSGDAWAQRKCAVRDEPLPRSCAALNARKPPELWKGDFSGRCVQGERERRLFGHGCFLSERDCQEWIYRMQSIADGQVRQAECRRL